MVVTMCPERDDYHAPFAHRIVVPKTTLVMRDQNGKPYVVTNPSQPVFIICAECDHWIARIVPKCRCRMRCHPGS